MTGPVKDVTVEGLANARIPDPEQIFLMVSFFTPASSVMNVSKFEFHTCFYYIPDLHHKLVSYYVCYEPSRSLQIVKHPQSGNDEWQHFQ
jgi:hypothetical protein